MPALISALSAHALQEAGQALPPCWWKACLAQHSSDLAATTQHVAGLLPRLDSVKKAAKKEQTAMRNWDEKMRSQELDHLDDELLQFLQQKAEGKLAAAQMELTAVQQQLRALQGTGQLGLGVLPAALLQDPVEHSQLAAERNQLAARCSALEAEKKALAASNKQLEQQVASLTAAAAPASRQLPPVASQAAPSRAGLAAGLPPRPPTAATQEGMFVDGGADEGLCEVASVNR